MDLKKSANNVLDLAERTTEPGLRINEWSQRRHDLEVQREQLRRERQRLREQKNAKSGLSVTPLQQKSGPVLSSTAPPSGPPLQKRPIRKKNVAASVVSLHPGEQYELKNFFLGPGFAVPGLRYRVADLNIKPGTTFTAGTPLMTIERSGPFGPDFRVVAITLTCPEDGILCRFFKGKNDPVKRNDLLGSFIPLNQWKAFSDLLKDHQTRIGRIAARRSSLEKKLREVKKENALCVREARSEVETRKSMLEEKKRLASVLSSSDLKEIQRQKRKGVSSGKENPVFGNIALSDVLSAILEHVRNSDDPVDLLRKNASAGDLDTLPGGVRSVLNTTVPVPLEALLHEHVRQIFLELCLVDSHLDSIDHDIRNALNDPALSEDIRERTVNDLLARRRNIFLSLQRK